jgi:hypothetical protein
MANVFSDYNDNPPQDFQKDPKNHEAANAVHVIGSHEIPPWEPQTKKE